MSTLTPNDGPGLGLAPGVEAKLPLTPVGWTAFPSLGGGFGAKKWFTSQGVYKEVFSDDGDFLAKLCAEVDAQYAPLEAAYAVVEAEEAVQSAEAPAEPVEAPAAPEAPVAPVV